MYTLWYDRIIEYGWVWNTLPFGTGLLLDVGTPQGYPTPAIAAMRGYHVIVVDLTVRDVVGGGIEYRNGDFLMMEFPERFDWILNISSIEHFGMAGRYGVTTDDPDADLKAMIKLHTLMTEKAKMILTVPVGIDTVIYPLHRVYGVERLPILLNGYTVLQQAFYGKRNDIDKYVPIDKAEALGTKVRCANPHSESATDHYYALGCFVLEG